jgi:hypothetical protein
MDMSDVSFLEKPTAFISRVEIGRRGAADFSRMLTSV